MKLAAGPILLGVLLLPAARADERSGHVQLRAQAVRWAEENAEFAPVLTVRIGYDRTLSWTSLEGVGPETVEQVLGLPPEDLRFPLGEALLHVALARRTRVMGPPSLQGGPVWDEVLARCDAWIEEGFAAYEDRVQPAGALQERIARIRRRVQDEIHAHAWAWSSLLALRVVTFDDDGEWEPVEPLSWDALQARVSKRLSETDAELPGIDMRRGEIEYHWGAPRPPVDAGLDPQAPLLEALIRVEMFRRRVAEREAFGVFVPAIEKAEQQVAEGFAELAGNRHAASVLVRRMVTFQSRAEKALFDGLWDVATRYHWSLWPVYSASELDMASVPSLAEASAEEPPGRLRVLLQPEHVRLDVTWLPGMYETRSTQVCVEPEKVTRVWVPPVLGLDADGNVIVEEPGYFEETFRPAIYEGPDERTVCVTPSTAETRTVPMPAVVAGLDVGDAFGTLRHVWFLDRWTWEHRPELRPPVPGAWDEESDHPPGGLWRDLLASEGPVLGRRRLPYVEGYLIVVGERGADGPTLVRLDAAKPVAFPAPTRLRR